MKQRLLRNRPGSDIATSHDFLCKRLQRVFTRADQLHWTAQYCRMCQSNKDDGKTKTEVSQQATQLTKMALNLESLVRFIYLASTLPQNLPWLGLQGLLVTTTAKALARSTQSEMKHKRKLTVYVLDNTGGQTMTWECDKDLACRLSPGNVMRHTPAGDGAEQQTEVILPSQLLRWRYVVAQANQHLQ